MTKVARLSLKLRTKRLVKKMTARRTKRFFCDESSSASSEDNLPILPQTSSGELSAIEEEHTQAAVNESDASSNYMSSLIDLESTSSNASISGNYQRLLNTSVGNLFGNSESASVRSNGNSNIPDASTVQQNIVDIPLESVQLAGLDLNRSFRSKNFSHGMMNLALLAANGNQLKYLIESAEDRPLFIISLSLIAACIVIQIFVKVCLLISSRFDVMKRENEWKVKVVNGLITYATSLLVIVTFCLTGIILAEMNGFKL